MPQPPHPDRPSESDRQTKSSDTDSKQSAEATPATARHSRLTARLALLTVVGTLTAGAGAMTAGAGGLISGWAAAANPPLTAEQNSMTRQRQRHDRFQDASKNLGDSDIAVRINGVKTMKDLMHDYPSEQPDVIVQLSDFVRARASKPLSTEPYKPVTCPNEPIPDDAKAALKAIKERNPAYDGNVIINLSSTCLPYADLTGGMFANANFTSSFLDHAYLDRAELTGACFRDTYMHDLKARQAVLFRAIFRGTFLYKANFTDALHDNTTEIRGIEPDPSITGRWWQEANENVHGQPLPSDTPTRQACLGP